MVLRNALGYYADRAGKYADSSAPTHTSRFWYSRVGRRGICLSSVIYGTGNCQSSYSRRGDRSKILRYGLDITDAPRLILGNTPVHRVEAGIPVFR